MISGTYAGATLGELRAAGSGRRAVGLARQDVLFPHRGTAQLTAEALVLEGWRAIGAAQIAEARQEFLREYGHWQAGGARGGFPSFGLLGRVGAPVVLGLAGGETLVLLFDFQAVTGATKNARWLDEIRHLAHPS